MDLEDLALAAEGTDGLQHAAARRWWQRSLDSAEATGQRYNEALTHLELGRRLGDASHVARGEALLSEIRVKAPP